MYSCERNASAVLAIALLYVAVLVSTCTAVCIRKWHRILLDCLPNGIRLARPVLCIESHPKEMAATVVVPVFFSIQATSPC